MAIKKSGKVKNFTFRITEDQAQQIAEIKAKCKQHGITWNITDALTKALTKEIKAAQKYINDEHDKSWRPGQKNLNLRGKKK